MKLKNFLLLANLFVINFLFAQTSVSDTIITGGVARAYRLYIPAIYNPANPVPLVFNLHGYGSNNTQQELYGDFRPVADTANFIIALPQGLNIGGGAGWNNFGSVASANADLNFIADLIDTLSQQYNINLNKVYSTGMSNGGFMSYDIACFMSDRFAAIASVTGSMIPSHKNACNPQHPMPVMEIHGTTDPVVSYTGSGGSLTSTHIDSLVKFFVNFNNCNNAPSFAALPDINTADNCTAEHYLYSGGLAGSSVELYKIINGGHSWPGAVYPTTSGNTNEDFNASVEIWRFFSQYNLDDLTVGIKNKLTENEFSIYPNPSNGFLTLEFKNYDNAFIEIFNSTGEKALEQKISTVFTAINMKKYSGGIYFYLVRNKSGIIKSGKVIMVENL